MIASPERVVTTCEDTYEALSDTVAATNITNSTTTTTIAVTTGAKFQVGDIVMIDSDDEQMYVSGISSNTLTVVRGYGGTTQTTHASNGTIYRRTRARVEGATATDSPSTDVTTGYNVSQILQKKIEISGTRQVVSQYGVTNEYEREVEKAYLELMRHLELAGFWGQRGTSTSRSMGGLGFYITTNATGNVGVLTQKHIEDKVQAAWEYGGKPTLLVCNAWVQRKIRDMYVGHYRTEKDTARGGILVDKILVPPVGEVDLLVDRFCPAGHLYLIDPNKVGYVPVREFFDEKLAKVGDAESGQVVGEYSLVVQNEKAHAKLTGISTTA